MRSVWPSLVKLVIYSTVVVMGTALLVLVIVNGRTGETETFRAVFADAGGVTTNDNVKIAGVTVGKVTGIEVVDRRKAEVEFTVERGIDVPESVRIAMQYENLIGDRYLSLERTGSGGAPALAPGSTIPESRTEPALNLTVLFGGFRPLFQALQPNEVNEFAENVLQTLQGQGGTVDELLARTASLTNTIADRDQVIGRLVRDLNSVLETVSARDQELSGLLVQLQRFVSGLSEDRQQIGTAISSIDSLTNSVAGLLDEARPPLKRDIAALGDLAANLDEGKGAIDRQLRVMPELLNRVDRTASYGAWFQFYLCDLGGSVAADGGDRSAITAYQNSARRCSS